jgi:chromosomal replication initiation ATPase DnaA
MLEIDTETLICRTVYRPWHLVLDSVTSRTGVPAALLRSRQRHPALTAARALAVRELRAAGYSYPEIGRILGGRHHTTAIWLERRAQ